MAHNNRKHQLGRCPVSGKVQFTSEGQCIRRIIKNSRDRGVALRAYLCPHCDYWHQTSKPAWGRQAVAS